MLPLIKIIALSKYSILILFKTFKNSFFDFEDSQFYFKIRITVLNKFLF